MKRKSILLGILLFGNHTVFSINRSEALSLLGLDSSANQDSIRAAYKKLVLLYHPDKWVAKSDIEKKDAVEKFKDIQAAYELLTSEQDSPQELLNEKIRKAKEIVETMKDDYVKDDKGKTSRIRGLNFYIDKYLIDIQNQKDYPNFIDFLKHYIKQFDAVLSRTDIDRATFISEINALLQAERQKKGMGAAGEASERQRKEQEERARQEADRLRREQEQRQENEKRRAADEKKKQDELQKNFQDNKKFIISAIVSASDYSILAPISKNPIPASLLVRLKESFFFMRDLSNADLSKYLDYDITLINKIQNFVLSDFTKNDQMSQKIKKYIESNEDGLEMILSLNLDDTKKIENFIQVRLFEYSLDAEDKFEKILNYFFKTANISNFYDLLFIYKEKFNSQVLIPAFKKCLQDLKPFFNQKLLEKQKNAQDKFIHKESESRKNIATEEFKALEQLMQQERQARDAAMRKEQDRKQKEIAERNLKEQEARQEQEFMQQGFLRKMQDVEYEEMDKRNDLDNNEYFALADLKGLEKAARYEALQNEKFRKEREKQADADWQEGIRRQKEQEERLRRANDPKNREMLIKALDLAMSLRR